MKTTLFNHTSSTHWSDLVAVGFVALFLVAPQAMAQAQATTNSARPEVWMGPPASENGKSLRELFAHPDQWQQTRTLIDGLLYADHHLNRQFTDDELRSYFADLQKWQMKFSLEVGAIKEWGITGTNTFTKQRPMWDRFQRLGGNIYAIAMDEPLLCTRRKLHKPDDYAVQETASFIALVRQHYPQILIGDIETYPSIPLADHLWWLDALQKRLAEMHVRGLDFYRLDVNWVEFNVFGRGSWPEVKKLEQECRKRKMPFSLIYWASDYPPMKKRGFADDSTWYVSIMRQGYDYALVNGAPDQYVIESWVDAPAQSLPETNDFTFTRSVRDFAKKFVK